MKFKIEMLKSVSSGLLVEGDSPEDALANFAARYFEAVPVSEDKKASWEITERACRPEGTEAQLLGSLDFKKGTVTVIDPCYNKDVWCRLDGICIIQGTYNCYVEFQNEGEWGVRVARIGIYLQNADKYHEAIRSDLGWKHLGDIGVDAGLAGIFERKENFSNGAWHDFCNDIHEGEAWIVKGETLHGFFSSSGYGDGAYDVFGHVAQGSEGNVFNAIEVVFIENGTD